MDLSILLLRVTIHLRRSFIACICFYYTFCLYLPILPLILSNTTKIIFSIPYQDSCTVRTAIIHVALPWVFTLTDMDVRAQLLDWTFPWFQGTGRTPTITYCYNFILIYNDFWHVSVFLIFRFIHYLSFFLEFCFSNHSSCLLYIICYL